MNNPIAASWSVKIQSTCLIRYFYYGFFCFSQIGKIILNKFLSKNEIRMLVDNYMIFYNEKRTHAKNGYKTPAKRELEFFSKQANKSNNQY